MKIRKLFISQILLLSMIGAACSQEQKSIMPPSSPNIVIILADDLGYGDPQVYNSDSKIPTPHIDNLAKQGMRFTAL